MAFSPAPRPWCRCESFLFHREGREGEEKEKKRKASPLRCRFARRGEKKSPKNALSISISHRRDPHRERHHVLQRPGHLDAHPVGARAHDKIVGGEQPHEQLCRRRARRRDRRLGEPSPSHLLGDVGSHQHRRLDPEHALDHRRDQLRALGPHAHPLDQRERDGLAGAPPGAVFGVDSADEASDDAARMLMRHAEQQDVRPLHRRGQVGLGADVGAQLHAGEVLDVLVLLVDDLGELPRFSSPRRGAAAAAAADDDSFCGSVAARAGARRSRGRELDLLLVDPHRELVVKVGQRLLRW